MPRRHGDAGAEVGNEPVDGVGLTEIDHLHLVRLAGGEYERQVAGRLEVSFTAGANGAEVDDVEADKLDQGSALGQGDGDGPAVGLPQQLELFETLGGPVVDAADVLRDPRGTLVLLCDALGIGFDEAMLSWPSGPRDTDGVWAKHWYAGVVASTGFARHSSGSGDPLPDRLAPLLERCRPFYDALAPYRLSPQVA